MPKIFKMFFPKKSFGPILNLDANVTSCKICFIHSFSNTWKIPYFGHILGPFWPKNFKIKLSPKKSLHSFLNICATVTSCKKNRKISIHWFLISTILHFGTNLGHIWHRNLKTKCQSLVPSQLCLAPFCSKTSKQDFSQKISQFVLL